jgi:ABC-type multidrug transport system fused ATPase/permease subunit
MGESLLSLLQAISNLSSAVGCINHIQKLLNQSERVDDRTHRTEALPLAPQHLPPCLVTKNVSAGWEGPIVRNISFEIPFGSLAMLVGPVGCGKSTLLKAILGETLYNVGDVHIHSPNIAYCSQTPWLVNRSIRDNVVGASSYREDWYMMVIKACGLQTDIAGLIKGDDTMVGTKGVSLSGGQKQRLVGGLSILYQLAN